MTLSLSIIHLIELVHGQTWTNWASGLSVDFGGTIFTDWRLPSTVDDPYVYGTNGTTTGGFNITSSEMGHLFYTELGNKGYYDTSGNYVGDGNWGLINTGDFKTLKPEVYWSGTEHMPFPGSLEKWVFWFYNGRQEVIGNGQMFALAVMDGDVAPEPIPEPNIIILPTSYDFGSINTGLHFNTTNIYDFKYKRCKPYT